MVAAQRLVVAGNPTAPDEALFERIALGVEQQGFSVCPAALPLELANALYTEQQLLGSWHYRDAGVGRGGEFQTNPFVRSDEICWMGNETDVEQLWRRWASALQQYLNRRLFLGLFSFESHYAHYRPGDFYKRHVDAFRGQANRVLSLVVYLNPAWNPADGGELVLYRDEQDFEGIRVVPLMGTVAVFLSEEFPHEVLPARKDRYSVAGWYRVNATQGAQIDPPR